MVQHTILVKWCCETAKNLLNRSVKILNIILCDAMLSCVACCRILQSTCVVVLCVVVLCVVVLCVVVLCVVVLCVVVLCVVVLCVVVLCVVALFNVVCCGIV